MQPRTQAPTASADPGSRRQSAAKSCWKDLRHPYRAIIFFSVQSSSVARFGGTTEEAREAASRTERGGAACGGRVRRNAVMVGAAAGPAATARRMRLLRAGAMVVRWRAGWSCWTCHPAPPGRDALTIP